MCHIVGFHNSSLYEALRASIGPLVSLLHDREDKTRANAAGALGNLVRNSGLLCRPLIEARALQVYPILRLMLNSWALGASKHGHAAYDMLPYLHHLHATQVCL